MHKYYDPKLFDVMDVDDLKIAYAPKEDAGVLLTRGDADALEASEKKAKAVDLTITEHFIAAGFDVNFVGPAEEIAGVSGAGTREGTDSAGTNRGNDGAASEEVCVDEETFGLWLDSVEFSVGSAVQRWWTGLSVCEEGDADGMKKEDDETNVEFFRRIRDDLRAEMDQCKEGGQAPHCMYPPVKDGAVTVGGLVR